MEKLKKGIEKRLKGLRQKLRSTPPKIRKEMRLCILASLLLSLLAFLSSSGSTVLQDGFRLPRSHYGGPKQHISLEVSGLSKDEAVPLDITVSPKRYTKEEANAVFQEIYEKIEELVVPEGESFANLQHDLTLMTKLPDEGVQLSWDFYPELDQESSTTDSEEERRTAAQEYVRSYRHLMDSDGTLHNEALPAGTVVTGCLSLIMSTDIVPEEDEGTTRYLKTQYHSSPYRIPVNIVPRTLSRYESLLLQLQNAITSQDEGSLGENTLSLPTEIDGQPISYREHRDRSYLWLPLLGVIAAMAIYMRQGQLKREEQKKRANLLLLDYSELVSKLMVYIGAGLTIRNALETISRHFDALLERGIQEDRPLYQELRTMVLQFQRNIPESEIYLSFGRRVNLKPYTKLVSLIEQNRQNGSKNLRSMLELEMEDAFEERKTTARRLGEEAGTKLLLPLFLMLGIVMVIVIVPAMSALG